MEEPKPRTKPGPKPRVKRDKRVDADRALKSQNQLELEEEFGRVLTIRQKTFAELYVEGQLSAAECARRAGYALSCASSKAVQLLDGKTFPHVVIYITQLREDKERLYGVTLSGQLERLYRLSRGAEEHKQFSAAINAEKLRAALGGLTVDRRENINVLDQMSRDQIVNRLAELQRKYPEAFVVEGTFKDVTDGRTRGKPLADREALFAPRVPHDAN